ncbi:hypothetical protein L9F63_018100 [Diploptera punctata]|uniref:Uncharacterized protein n=1 Tax=Diploptera punctata TaxID=6984 RepID=A0AAD7ZZ98_DIPPU|nr:hypothetical protein L9F63_018100 [Diploptera punctata]
MLNETAEEFADTILYTLKKSDYVINSVLFIFTSDQDNYKDDQENTIETSIENITTIYAYTLYPYLNGACNQDVPSLIGKWSLDDESDQTISSINFFPNKVPRDLMGCVLNIGAVGPEPYAIKQAYTNEEQEDKIVLEGIGVVLIKLFAREINATSKYLEPVTKLDTFNMLGLAVSLKTGEMDILAGAVPATHPLFTYIDISVAVFIDTLKYLVPCPKAVAKTDKILTLFSSSTWTCMAFVMIFVSVLFWGLSNYPVSTSDFIGFRMFSQCFGAAWAILLGVSVPQMPLSLRTRNLFIIYVWYCFAISTIFQAFFTSYLVEPGYEARLKNLDDVIKAGLKLGSYEMMNNFEAMLHFEELKRFNSVYYDGLPECIAGVMFGRQTFSPALDYFGSYIASVSGIQDQKKVVCFLDETVLTLPIGVGMIRGYPLLEMLNQHIRRSMEAGLLHAYWSKFKNEINLNSNNTEEDSEYVVFNLTHLAPGFVLLFFGYILSVIIFLCELVQFAAKKLF